MPFVVSASCTVVPRPEPVRGLRVCWSLGTCRWVKGLAVLARYRVESSSVTASHQKGASTPVSGGIGPCRNSGAKSTPPMVQAAATWLVGGFTTVHRKVPVWVYAPRWKFVEGQFR